MKLTLLVAGAIGLALWASGSADASTPVYAIDSGTTDLGSFAAGSYEITAVGVVSLAGPVGSGFDINPDGTPHTPVTFPGYTYFNPSGSNTDINDPYLFGAGGSTIKLGELMGSLIAVAPVGNYAPPQTNYFPIGYSDIIHLSKAGDIYAQVNDSYYGAPGNPYNNAGAFAVTVTSVPEPATWAMMLFGVGGVGATMRLARRKSGVALTA